MAGEGFDPCPRNGMSYVVGDTEVPLAHVTVPALLEATVNRYPDAEAVVFREQGVRWTWRTFAEQVDALAAGLHALGLERGDRIGIWSPNRYEWVLTQFATARLGLILVNINPAYRLSELEYALNKVGCKAIVAAEAFKTSRYLEMLQTLAPELATAQPGALNAAKLPALRWVIRMGEVSTPGMINFADVITRGKSVPVDALDAITNTLSPDDAINIQFTSGTTGAPKGATLTHVNVVNNARFVAMAMNLQAGDRLCIPMYLSLIHI